MGMLGARREKSILNPMSVFCVEWGVIILFSTLNLYGELYKPSSHTYAILFWGTVSFAAGYFILKVLSKGKGVKLRRSVVYEKTINYQYCYIALILVDVFLLYRAASIGVSFFRGGINLREIGQAVSEAEGANSGLLNALSFLVISPLQLPLTIVTCVDLIYGRKDRKLLLLSLIMVVGRILTTGGRIAVIHIILGIVAGISLGGNSRRNEILANAKKIIQKRKKIVAAVFVIIIGFFIFLTFTKVNTQSPFENIFMDFAIQPMMFETWAKDITDSNSYSFGFASLFGFVHPPLYILKNLLRMSDIPSFFAGIYSQILDTFYTWIRIGLSCRANAYATAFWYMYYDAREIGVVVGMFIWGAITCNYYIRANRRFSLLTLAKYAMIFVGVFYSYCDMEFYKASYVLGFLYLSSVLFKKGRINADKV